MDLAPRRAMDSPQDEPPTTQWCAGGCQPWQETEDGRERYRELYARWLQLRGRP